MYAHHGMPALRRFFCGLTEYAFQSRMGVADPPLVEYISELLMRFVRLDEVFRVRMPNGRQLDQVVDMLIEAQQRQGTARREVHRHIGDYTLFWTGVFPEAIARLAKSDTKDSLIDYRAHGKRAYKIASVIPAEPDHACGELLERLSDQFELCVYGLTEVRREWERREGTDPSQPLWIK